MLDIESELFPHVPEIIDDNSVNDIQSGHVSPPCAFLPPVNRLFDDGPHAFLRCDQLRLAID